jgi:hypothetical protein
LDIHLMELVLERRNRRNANNTDQTRELEMQLEATKVLVTSSPIALFFILFKHIESDRIARIALRAKLKKHHLSTDLDVMSVMDRHLMTDLDDAHTPGTPAVKVVESRLLSSKVLASETTRVVENLKATFFPTSPDDDENASVSGAVESSKGRNEASTLEEMDESSSSSELGSSDRTESGSGSESNAEQVTGLEGSKHESSSDSDETRHREKKDQDSHSGTGVQLSAKSKVPVIAESDSLPSLAVGYARGDSDGTDWSDSEVKPAMTRKNRRGQRARRAYVLFSFPFNSKPRDRPMWTDYKKRIWEKKYGKHANHMKKQNQVNDSFGKYPIQPFDRAREKRVRNSGVSGAAFLAARNPLHADVSRPTPLGNFPTPQERPLHPSWEAKKKLKEQQHSKVSRVRGKKIKFS